MEQQVTYMRGSRPVSTRYMQYERRIQRIGRIVSWIRKHKFLTAATIAAVTGLILLLLSSIGSFMSTFTYPDHVYGDAPAQNLIALFYHPRYEFAKAGNDPAWSEEVPIFPGEYQVRAYTKNGFGRIRYTQVLTFSILPRELSIRIDHGEYFYGDMSQDYVRSKTTVEGLADSDSIEGLYFSLTEDAAHSFSADVENFHIRNREGVDVTACYAIHIAEGSFTMKPRPITVRAENAEKEYDGLVWEAGEAKISAGSLVAGDSLVCRFESFPADVGIYAVMPHISIVNTDGNDVTEYYEVQAISGTLKVFPRVLALQSEGAKKIYDAKPLTNRNWGLVSGEIVLDHRLEVKVTGSQTAVGTSENVMQPTVLDKDGRDVSGNYTFDLQPGYLIVEPIVLKVKTDSAEKVYDGKPLSAGGELVDGKLLNGHKISIRCPVEPVNAGIYENTPKVVITNKQGVDVTLEGYRVETECGVLRITKRPLTFASGSAEKLYDGTALICYEYEFTSGKLGKQDGQESIYVVNFTGEQKDVGSSENTFGLFITSAAGNDTTKNYDITYIFGTLTVLENPNYKDPGISGGGNFDSDTKISFPDNGDGESGPVALLKGISGFHQDKRIYLRSTSYGDYNFVGWKRARPSPNYDTESSPLKFVGRTLAYFGNSTASLHIQRLDGCPVIMPYFTADPNGVFMDGNDCYFLNSINEFDIDLYPNLDYDNYEYADVMPSLEAQEKSYSRFVYSHYLQVPSSTKEELLNWAERVGISADSATLVGDIQQAVLTSAEYNLEAEEYPADVDVEIYFLTEAREGICQHFASAATLLYRVFGIPARYTVGFTTTVKNGTVTELYTDNAHAWVEIYVDGLGWIPIEVTPGGGGSGVGGSIAVSGYSATKYYDGKPFDLSAFKPYSIEKGFLRKGHRLEVTFHDVSKFVQPGSYELAVKKYAVYDKDGKDVTDQYKEISIKPGVLTILPRPIVITTGSAFKVYDGLPLQCLDYWISSGSLVSGDRLVLKMPTVLTEPGSVYNEIADLKILHYSGNQKKDVTKCYEIIYIFGELTVMAAP